MTMTTAQGPRPFRLSPVLMLLSLLALAACGGRTATYTPGTMRVPQYTGDESFVWCVPYARFVSGVNIRGDADTWWDQASGRYLRDRTPGLGAVLTLKPDNRLRSGHVAVVTAIDGPRDIRVSHANWGWNDTTRGRIYEHMPARDVSPNNDWSEIRFKHPEVNGYGRGYPALGFIHPETRFAADEPAQSRPVTVASSTTRPEPFEPQPFPVTPISAPAPASPPPTARSLQLW
jgi:surface antigen